MVHVSVQSCQNLWCSTTASPEFPWSCFRNCWSTVSAALSGYAYSINWTVPYFFLSVISLCLLFDDGLYQPNFIKSKLLSKWTRIKCQNSSVSSRLLLNTDLDTSDYTFKFGLLRRKHFMNTTTCLLHQLLFFFMWHLDPPIEPEGVHHALALHLHLAPGFGEWPVAAISIHTHHQGSHNLYLERFEHMSDSDLGTQ